MGLPPSQSRTASRAFRLTEAEAADPGSQRREWLVDFDVRGERVPGRLLACPATGTELAPFTIRVHGRAEPHADPSREATGSTTLELSWPLLGSRHDVKLSPLLIRSFSETRPSSAQDALWKRFCDQAVHEVEAARSGMEAQTQCPIGPFSELILEIGDGEVPAKRATWSANSRDSLDLAQCVRDFLSEVRPQPER